MAATRALGGSSPTSQFTSTAWPVVYWSTPFMAGRSIVRRLTRSRTLRATNEMISPAVVEG